MTDYNSAWAFVAALAGDPNTAVMDWRAIHDTNAGVPAMPRRGTLPDLWPWLVAINGQGYGVFAIVNATDGHGRKLENISHVRAHVVDLDNISAPANFQRVMQAHPQAGFAVQTSPNKFHAYWPVMPYSGNDRYELVQRKLVAVFDSDPSVIDATRVMRVPGFFHMKNPTTPHMVTCWSLAGYGRPTTIEALEAALASVTALEGGHGGRHPLGSPELAAPSLAWLDKALELVDPNELTRGEWIAITSAVKQSGWSLTDGQALFDKWSAWCARYGANDLAENLKQWDSIRDTELGWKSLVNRVPSLKALVNLGGQDRSSQLPKISTEPTPPGGPAPSAPPVPEMPVQEPPRLDCNGAYLTHLEQQSWFRDCISVVSLGNILTPDGRLLNQTQFNMQYGGKYFIIDAEGKKTKSAWEAATTSTLWTIPKVDHLRFLPDKKTNEIVFDRLGRRGVNTYIPVELEVAEGDAGPFLRHIAAMLPDPNDQTIFLTYLAHNIKFPGHKIPWAPLIQSAEGVGKGWIMEAMSLIMGDMYCYSPKAEELVKSGSKFNGWMRNKLLIVVNEIKVDERRELIEILKPMISDKRVEVEAKGMDQKMEDNPANWIFFSNYKDAIPVDKNGRRYAIFYSAIQSADDLRLRGMTDAYFSALFKWLEEGGYKYINHWLLNFPIERGQIPMRAPATSSMAEAVRLSRGPVEVSIMEAVEDGLQGFRGGWISSYAVLKRLKASNAVQRLPSAQTLEGILTKMGYTPCGRSPRAYFQEENQRSSIFHFGGPGNIEEFGPIQGYDTHVPLPV